MKFTEYFIHHKVAAIIINAMILIVGFMAFRSIVVREYPDIKLPVISIMTFYPNANPELVESSVTNFLEDEISAVPKIKSISSDSKQNQSQIIVNFEEGTDIDAIMVDVREAVAKAKTRMPKEVLDSDIHKGGGFGGVPFFAVSISSSKLSQPEITHYAKRYLTNNFRSVRGVSTVQTWGSPYSMVVTLDPKKLYNYRINVHDVMNAVEGRNISLPTGNYQNSLPSTLDLRLESEEDFERTLIANKNGKAIYLKDVADVKLGVDSKENRTKVNGKPGVIISIERNSDANPLEVASKLREKVEVLKQNIPEHLNMNIEIDQSIFIKSSISNIQSTIVEAVILVLLIVFIFLGNLSSTLIPLITVPISLMGSIAVLLFFGMSLNVFTLLAMVLAIGLVVDDAIIVLENITRHIEDGMKPLQAAIKGSAEIGFAIIAMTLTLASVYAPIAFVTGVSGQMFTEFAITLAGSVIISGIVALTLSPLMCAMIIGPHKKNKFEQFLSNMESSYKKFLDIIFTKNKLIIGIVVGSLIVSYLAIKITPGELLPPEDRSLMGAYIPSQPGKNLDDMEMYEKRAAPIIASIPEKGNYLTFIGHWGMSIVAPLKPHGERSRTQQEIVSSIEPITRKVPTIDVWAWGYDSGIVDIGAARDANNVTFALQTTGTYKELADAANKLTQALNGTGKFIYVMQDAKFDSQKFDIIVDKTKFAELGINPLAASRAIGTMFSGNQDFKFSKDDIRYPITFESTKSPWSLSEIYVIGNDGTRIPLAAFAKMQENVSMTSLKHHNQMRSANFTGMPMPPNNIESLIPMVEKIVKETLPNSFMLSWTGSAQMQKDASNTMTLLFLMAIIFIYAILAVQFNSFVDPMIIMFTVPLACSGALFMNWFFGYSINVYTQIGLITLVGLITKHGILMVEFANQLQTQGKGVKEAIMHSSKLRLRPILMTTGAMILGTLPLIIASGAGAEARHVIGIVIVWGLGIGTIFTLFVLPRIYYWVKNRIKSKT